jgi:hypothetical protein
MQNRPLIFRTFSDVSSFFLGNPDLKTQKKRNDMFLSEKAPKCPDFWFNLITQSTMGMAAGAKAADLLIGKALRIVKLPDDVQLFVRVFSVGLGALFGGGFTMKFITKSEDMWEWKLQKTKEGYFEIIDEKLQEHEILQEFVCPISQKVVVDPVRTPWGTIYDRDALLRCKRYFNGNFEDPMRNGEFSESQIFFDYEVLFIVSKVKKEIVQKEQGNAKTPNLHEYLGYQVSLAVNNLELSYQEAKNLIISLKGTEGFDVEKELEEFENYFGKTAYDTIDLSLSWHTILTDRFRKFYPLIQEKAKNEST